MTAFAHGDPRAPEDLIFLHRPGRLDYLIITDADNLEVTMSSHEAIFGHGLEAAASAAVFAVASQFQQFDQIRDIIKESGFFICAYPKKD